jgi:hypothetical protein
VGRHPPFLGNGGAVTDLMQQLGHSKLETTQIYPAAVSERRRATVMALPFAGTRRHRAAKKLVPNADAAT